MSEVPPDSELLNQYLADRDEPCPLCGYNLRSLRGAHCPECGRSLRLQVGLVHPNLRSYVAGLIPLAGAFGFTFLTLVWVMYMTMRYGPGPDPWGYVLIIGQTIVSGVLMLAWMKSSRWIRTTTPGKRLGLLFLAWMLPVAIIVLFFLILEGI